MINLPGIRQGGYALHQWEIYILLALIIYYHCSLLPENISPFGSILVGYDKRRQQLSPLIFYKDKSFSLHSFNNQLRRVCSRFATRKTNGCTAGGSQSEIDRAAQPLHIEADIGMYNWRAIHVKGCHGIVIGGWTAFIDIRVRSWDKTNVMRTGVREAVEVEAAISVAGIVDVAVGGAELFASTAGVKAASPWQM